MLNFFKNNKTFTIFLTLIVGFIGFLGISSIQIESGDIPPGFVEEPLPPSVENPPVTKPIEINSFSGSFLDSKNTIALKWNVTENDEQIETIELYREDQLIEDVTDKTGYECPIQAYGITTGLNNFTLKVTSTDGEIVEKTTTVNVNYIFDVSKTSQFVDNNIGKGVLLSITYSHHKQTPVGIPVLSISTTLQGYYQQRYLERETTPLTSGYEQTTVYYFMTFDATDQNNVTWNILYDFASVGIQEEDVIVRDITNINYETQTILLPSMKGQGA